MNESPSDAVGTVAAIRPTRVVLVDDNADALTVLSVLLELEGHSVVTSDNGRAALRLIEESRPGVAIIDVGMPEMDGFEVARALRANPVLSGVALVALTGFASASDKAQALAAGFDYHLTKPLSLEKLQSILSDLSCARAGDVVPPGDPLNCS